MSIMDSVATVYVSSSTLWIQSQLYMYLQVFYGFSRNCICIFKYFMDSVGTVYVSSSTLWIQSELYVYLQVLYGFSRNCICIFKYFMRKRI
jgi:hypothetical protein